MKTKILLVYLVSHLIAGCALFNDSVINSVSLKSLGEKNKEVDLTNKVGYYLPSARVQINIIEITHVMKGTTKVVGEPGFDFTFKPIYAPDPKHYYILSREQNLGFDDDITVSLTEEGFLSRISSITEDTSPKIAAKLVEMAATVLKAEAAIPLIKAETEEVRKPVFESLFDPTDEDELKIIKQKVLEITDKRCSLDVSPFGQFDVQSSVDSTKRIKGIFFRPAQPFLFTVKKFDKDHNIKKVDSSVIFLPAKNIIMSVQIERNSFVKNETTLEFSKGILTSVQTKRPSPILGFISIPLDVLKAIVSIPGELLQFKVTNISKQKELIDAQRELIEAQKKLLEEQSKK